MRATIRITWLLLSLSFLLHNISSDDPDPASSSVSKAATTAGPTPAVASTGVSVSGNDITALTTKKQQPTQAPTTVKPTSVAPVSPVVMTTQPKPTDKPATNPPQAPTVTNKPAPAPTTISAVVKDTTVPAATPTPPKPTTLAATADSSGASRVVPNPPTTPKPENPVTTMTAVAGAPIVPTGNAANVRTTQNPKVSTVASTQREKPTTHITDPSTMSQGDSKVEQGGTEKTVVTAKSPEQTTSKALGPIVNTGTTSSIPTTPIKRGPPPAPKEATTSLQTTTTTTITTITTASLPTTFLYSLNSKHEKDEEKGLVEMCKRLMVNFQDGDCVLKLQRHNGEVKFDTVDIKGKVSPILAAQYYEEITKKPTDNKTLIAILASCGALLIMIVILAVCASHRRKPYNENQQHLTEELHTVENGYHDNPTLEVMEVQPEMQEKKVALNGEFNDSWIVPMDNLPKVCEEIPEEEDTHL